jgi:hypothetical protein
VSNISTISLNEAAAQLVVSGMHLAQAFQDALLREHSQFRKLSDKSMVLGGICMGAGFARLADLTKDEFLLLCSTAYDMLRGERKSKVEN